MESRYVRYWASELRVKHMHPISVIQPGPAYLYERRVDPDHDTSQFWFFWHTLFDYLANPLFNPDKYERWLAAIMAMDPKVNEYLARMVLDGREMQRPLYDSRGWMGRDELGTIRAINDLAGFVTIGSFQ